MVVIGGGVSLTFQIVSSVYVLDLNTREERQIGDLLGARAWFGMATLDGSVLAFGGMSPLYTRDQYSDILVLDRETEQWTQTGDSLETTLGISSFATAVVYLDEVCPST